jgi:hypothetical protein
MDKRYFNEFIYLLSGKEEMQILFWKMSAGNKEMYNCFSMKILSNSRKRYLLGIYSLNFHY